MAKNETVRIRPIILQEDRDAFSALKNVGAYSPSNASYAVTAITTAQTTLLDKREIEAQKQAELDAARDEAVAAEWAFHNLMLGAADQIKAQFGADSNEFQALGYKKKSEFKSPTRTTAPAPPAAKP